MSSSDTVKEETPRSIIIPVAWLQFPLAYKERG